MASQSNRLNPPPPPAQGLPAPRKHKIHPATNNPRLLSPEPSAEWLHWEAGKRLEEVLVGVRDRLMHERGQHG